MSFNIQSFISQVSKEGFARTSDFEIKIQPPSRLRDDALRNKSSVADSLTYRVESATMPGRTVQPIDYKDYGYPYKIGGLGQSLDVDLIVLCSPSLHEREFFMSWQDLIVGDHRRMADTSTDAKQKQFDIGYFDDYTDGEITIHQLSVDGTITRAVKLIQAYPLNVQPLTVNWNDSQIQKMGVTLAYRYFQEEQLNISDPDAALLNFEATVGVDV